ncbi:methyltransferase-like protein 23 isoform X2 [Hypomesus transpacificus]|uniref:methyltransferase-like protein 23 isoform X2 n=1 Tax=Hypomesus transpacificus TaxID=137520 RepID=UPI001F0783D3|nr:methyltransferase-like protein 23 isoform X2 [Hypomesus transpacificus]
MESSDTAGSNIVAKAFTFEGRKDTWSSLTVLEPQYGMYVWPSAVVLAQFVWSHRDKLPQKTVLELGAGVSLPGVVAAKCGAQVILSDSAEIPLCLENCRRTCSTNDLAAVRVVGLTWGEISPDLVLLPPVDVILGSDVFYEPEDFENVLVTITFLLRKNPEAQFWTTYQERSADWSIEALLHKWNLQCVNIPLERFQANQAHLAGSTLPGNHAVQMLIITLKGHVQKPIADGMKNNL